MSVLPGPKTFVAAKMISTYWAIKVVMTFFAAYTAGFFLFGI